MTRLLDTSHHLNPPIDEGLDEDMLTEQERLELGYEVNRQRHNKQVAKRCTDCNKSVAEPIMSYTFHGVEVLEPGEAVHKGCLDKRINALIAVVMDKLSKTNN